MSRPTLSRPKLQLSSVTIGSPRPAELARFYAELLGWQLSALESGQPDEPAEAGWAQLKPPLGETGPTLNFEYERAFRRPVWPAVNDEQLASQHLDIWVDDLAESTAWAIAAGAQLAEVQPQPEVRVFFDPDGHPFCLFR